MKKWSTKEPKFWNVMKFCAVQTVLAMALVGASIAHDGAGQVLEKRISLEMKDATLVSVLEKIERDAGIKFVYNPSFFNLQEKVSIVTQDATLKDILNELFEPRRIEYQIYEKESAIALRKAKNETGRSVVNEVPVNVASPITGRVTGGSPPEPLAGVNVLIKGTTTGTTTDASGKYEIQASEGDVIVFSFIGFQSQEILVNSQTVIDIVLNEDTKKLNEVVVNAGYWEVNEKENTGNIAKVTAKQLQTQSVANPMHAIQGRMAGVQVSQITGVPGDGMNIQVRGLNSLRSTANDPLYIIDGVPFSSSTLLVVGGNVTRGPSPLSNLNPSDIESIEVLKDADATAIYGSRGSNGVVLITTKKGKAGKTKADINIYTGIGTMSRQMDMLNTSQYVTMRKEAFKNDGVTPTTANAPDLLLWDTTRYTNWRKELLGGTARITSAQGSVSGGNASTQFLIGGGYFRQTTVFPGEFNYQKGSMHFNVGHTSVDSRFMINLTGSFVAEKNVLPQSDPTALVFSLAPNTPQVYGPTGNLNWENGTWNNPYGELKKTYQASAKNLVSSLNVSYQVLPGLRVKANVGLNYMTTDEKNLTPIAATNPASNQTGSSILTKGSITSWVGEPQIEYQRNIGNGKLTTLIGATFQQSLRERQGFIASGFVNDTQLENLGAAASLTPFLMEYSEYKYNAVFARVNYSFSEKYILNLTARRDGSSRFGPGKQFANFGAIGAAWIFSNEDFIQQALPSLSHGKVRASYGLTGSDQIGDYQYLDTYSSTANTYQGGKGLVPSRLLNPDYSWEENRKFEAGLELGFFDDRISFSLSYYKNRSSNQLVGYSLPAITGFTSVQSNLPAVIQNSGTEIVVTTTNVKKKSFTWTTSFNITTPTNLLVSYPNILGSSYANTYSVGRSLYVQKKFKSLGVDPQTGLYIFEDFDNSGTLSNPADTQFIKERKPDFYGGLQNSFSFGRFEFQFFLQFVKQTGSNYLSSAGSPPGFRSNQATLVLDRWRNTGDVKGIQRFTQGGAGQTAYSNASSSGDGVISDASFVRLQNASFSYTMPVRLSEKINAESIRFYLQGQNLFVITGYNGADPETQNVRTLSPLRIVSVGAQLTF